MPNLFNYPETQPQSLDDKIKAAVEFLQKAEKLALKMQPSHGFWLAFSGGKDSCVILELAKMAGVKFTAYYNVTTIDPPKLVRFIIEEHPEVVRLHPKKNVFQIDKRAWHFANTTTEILLRSLERKFGGGILHDCWSAQGRECPQGKAGGRDKSFQEKRSHHQEP